MDSHRQITIVGVPHRATTHNIGVEEQTVESKCCTVGPGVGKLLNGCSQWMVKQLRGELSNTIIDEVRILNSPHGQGGATPIRNGTYCNSIRIQPGTTSLKVPRILRTYLWNKSLACCMLAFSPKVLAFHVNNDVYLWQPFRSKAIQGGKRP